MIKTLSKVRIEGTYLNIIKVTSDKHTATIILNRKKLKAFFLEIRNKTGILAFTTLIQYSTGSSSHSDLTRKRNKRYPNWKGGSKTVIVCRGHDSVHKKCYRLHQNLCNLISKFGKTEG